MALKNASIHVNKGDFVALRICASRMKPGEVTSMAGRIVWPSFRVVHHGGGAARKGWNHIGWFVQSGVRFYRKHGWRFV